MAMGRKAQQGRQERFWVASTDLPQTVAHSFYEPVNRLLEEAVAGGGGFDEFVTASGKILGRELRKIIF
jgi:hypothetical protein